MPQNVLVHVSKHLKAFIDTQDLLSKMKASIQIQKHSLLKQNCDQTSTVLLVQSYNVYMIGICGM